MRVSASCGHRLLWAVAFTMAVADAAAESDAYARGARVYERCAACHALETDRTGPHHCGLFGRRAGSVPGFSYSPAMRRAGFVWNEKTLDRFLRSPTTAVPGTSMGYDGVKDDGERHDLILFLRQAGNAENCAQPAAGAGRHP